MKGKSSKSARMSGSTSTSRMTRGAGLSGVFGRKPTGTTSTGAKIGKQPGK